MDLFNWILSVDARSLSSSDLIEELGARVRSAGIPVCYISFSVFAMHPEVLAENLIWNADEGTQVFKREQATLKTDFFIKSPVYRIYTGLGGFRQLLIEDEAEFDFPILNDLKASGHTDYLIDPLPLSKVQTSYVSWSTKMGSGFTDEQINFLKKLTPYLASIVSGLSQRNGLTGLLQTYLGYQAGDLVRSGLFHRGDGTAVDAVIWFSDLRGFTEFTDNHTAKETLARLNTAFDIIGTSIYSFGGDILKFIGDAVLAVFPIGDGMSAEGAAQAALKAALDTHSVVKKWNAEHQHPLDLGIALHRGAVHFGNIGSSSRLDFTVIGAPVNEASRIESLCKELGEGLLISDVVAELIQGQKLRKLGLHTLRGVKNPRTLYSL